MNRNRNMPELYYDTGQLCHERSQGDPSDEVRQIIFYLVAWSLFCVLAHIPDGQFL
jgi:hypothetical protein